jgi:hypothetical protein
MTGIDHGELNIPLSKRYGKGGIDAVIDRHKADLAREARAQRKADVARRKAAREAEAARQKFTQVDVEGATHVRDNSGQWHKVVRVNAKSVTVETGYSWHERIDLGRIVQLATIEADR